MVVSPAPPVLAMAVQKVTDHQQAGTKQLPLPGTAQTWELLSRVFCHAPETRTLFTEGQFSTLQFSTYLQEEPICSSLGHHLGTARKKRVVGPAKGEEICKVLHPSSIVSQPWNLSFTKAEIGS